MTTILTRTVARLLLLPAFVVAAAFLVKGYSSVGDGFSAGAIAALGILIQYVAIGREEVERWLPENAGSVMAAAGLLLVLLVAFAPLALGEPPLTHFPRPRQPVIHLGTLELHTAILFDLGVFGVIFGFSLVALRLLAHLEEGL